MGVVTPKTDFIELLGDLMEYLDDHLDVVDADYGRPLPNRAMSLYERCRVALTELEEL